MTALLLVDIQNDFLPGGALGIQDADCIIPLVNALTQLPFDLIVACQDWHPPHHISFASTHGLKPGDLLTLEDGTFQTLWPDHCLQNTPGAALASSLDLSRVEKIFQKGIDRNIDSYSAFFDNRHIRSTGLGEFLKEHQIHTLFIAGLALDYCVKYSAKDAYQLGFHTRVVLDACKGVNLKQGDSERACEEIRKAHGTFVYSNQVQTRLAPLDHA